MSEDEEDAAQPTVEKVNETKSLKQSPVMLTSVSTPKLVMDLTKKNLVFTTLIKLQRLDGSWMLDQAFASLMGTTTLAQTY